MPDGQADTPTTPRRLAVTITPTTAALAATSMLATIGLWNVLRSARSIIATAVASVVVAVLLSGPIEVLDRRMPRALAIPLALLIVVAGLGGTAYTVYDDVDSAFARLQEEAPQAAAQLEESERFGEIATDLRLEARVSDAVDGLRTGAQDRARSTAFRVVNYFVAGILAIFFLVYGRRIFEGAIGQVGDERRRETIRSVVGRAVVVTRNYLGLELVNAAILGVGSGVVFHLLDLPGASALALLVAAGSVVPDVGVVVGGVPALLLTAAREPVETLVVLAAGVVALQAVESIYAHRILVRRLDVGPAVTLLAVLVGFGVYGIGGAIFGVAIAVFASAVLDATGEEVERGIGGDPSGSDGSRPAEI